MATTANDSLAFLEIARVSTGVRAADAALKKAPVTLVMSRPVSGPKYLLLLRGDVASIDEAFREARSIADAALLDTCHLPFANPQLWKLVGQTVHTEKWSSAEDHSVAIVETTGAAATIRAADAAAKESPVVLRDFQLAEGLSGRAFFTFSGDLADVQSSTLAAEIAASDALEHVEIIAAPADEIRGRLFR